MIPSLEALEEPLEANVSAPRVSAFQPKAKSRSKKGNQVPGAAKKKAVNNAPKNGNEDAGNAADAAVEIEITTADMHQNTANNVDDGCTEEPAGFVGEAMDVDIRSSEGNMKCLPQEDSRSLFEQVAEGSIDVGPSDVASDLQARASHTEEVGREQPEKSTVETLIKDRIGKQEVLESHYRFTGTLSMEERSNDDGLHFDNQLEKDGSIPVASFSNDGIETEYRATDSGVENYHQASQWEKEDFRGNENLTHEMEDTPMSSCEANDPSATEENNLFLNGSLKASTPTQYESSERPNEAFLAPIDSRRTTNVKRRKEWKSKMSNLDIDNVLTVTHKETNEPPSKNKRKKATRQNSSSNGLEPRGQEDAEPTPMDFHNCSLQNENFEALDNNLGELDVTGHSQEKDPRSTTKKSQAQRKKAPVKRGKGKDGQSNGQASDEQKGKRRPLTRRKKGEKASTKENVETREDEIQEQGSTKTRKVPKAKRSSQSTKRKQRRVEQHLLETPEAELDITKLKLKDLIRLAEAKERQMRKEEAAKRKAVGTGVTPNTEAVEPSKEKENQEGNVFAPQVQVIDGQIVINEASLLVSDRHLSSDDVRTFRRVEENGSKLNYNSYSNRTRTERWSKSETELFYKAMQQFGTNFEMIRQLFPGRTRNQVKAKFKIEEKKRPLKLSDTLLCQPGDTSHYQKLIDQLKVSTFPSENDNDTAPPFNSMDDFNTQDLSGHEAEMLSNQVKDLAKQTEKELQNFSEIPHNASALTSEVEDDPCSSVNNFPEKTDSCLGKDASPTQGNTADKEYDKSNKSLFSYQMTASKPKKSLFSYELS